MKSRFFSAFTVAVSTTLRKLLSVATSSVSFDVWPMFETRVQSVIAFGDGKPAATPCPNLPAFASGSRRWRASAEWLIGAASVSPATAPATNSSRRRSPSRPTPLSSVAVNGRQPNAPALARVNPRHAIGDSRSSSSRLRSSPPANPVSLPLAPITRWQGITTAIGLRPLAAPTARALAGQPMRSASSP